MKLKLMLIKNGISNKTGNPYTIITVRGKRTDGSSVSNDFFISESVKNQLVGLQEDDYIQLEFDLNENLYPSVVGIYKDEADA